MLPQFILETIQLLSLLKIILKKVIDRNENSEPNRDSKRKGKNFVKIILSILKKIGIRQTLPRSKPNLNPKIFIVWVITEGIKMDLRINNFCNTSVNGIYFSSNSVHYTY